MDLPKSYDTSYINTSANLQSIIEGIKNSSNARICLYGVAGKSAYAKFVASKLGCEIIIKKASEILAMYVGQTEKNIANAFYPIKDSDDFAKRLTDEVKIKNAESGSKLGFVR